jgi:hypothetical protein
MLLIVTSSSRLQEKEFLGISSTNEAIYAVISVKNKRMQKCSAYNLIQVLRAWLTVKLAYYLIVLTVEIQDSNVYRWRRWKQLFLKQLCY